MELYADASAELEPQDGEKILPASDLSFHRKHAKENKRQQTVQMMFYGRLFHYFILRKLFRSLIISQHSNIRH